jgi:outer membrane protein assembly factor BamB
MQEDRLFVQTWGRRVYALERDSGEILWQWSYPPSRADDHRQGALMTCGDLLLVPAWNGTLYALSQDNGELRWSLDLGAALRASPTKNADALWIGNSHGEVFKISLAGEILSRSKLGAAVLTPAGLSGDGPVFLTRDGVLNALTHDGALRWRRELGEICFYAAPVTSGDAMFVATAGGNLWKIDVRSGSVLWRARLSGPAYATPAVHGGRVYVGDNEGGLQVFNAASGTPLAEQALPAAIQGGPVAQGDALAVGARDGCVYLFQVSPSFAMGVSGEVF